MGKASKTKSSVQDHKSDMFKFIFDEDDIRWQSIIYQLVRNRKVDPWDVDISKFTKEYMATIEKLKQMNFRVSGKVVLAAAILLKLKTQHLGLDDFIVLTEDPEEDMALAHAEDEYIDPDEEKLVRLATHIRQNKKKKYKIEPKLVGPRRRKVTVFELVGALKKALEVDERRTTRKVKFERAAPSKTYEVKKIDIFGKIKDVYGRLRIQVESEKSNMVPFNTLVGKDDKKETIWTFIPLLHLANEEKVWLHQDESFSEINVELLGDKK